MIKFVNAKINIGLQIVSRREDGYHNLQTIFYPVGLHAGKPTNPEVFCDVLEIVQSEAEKISLELHGNTVDCPKEKNLVWRAAEQFFDLVAPDGFRASIILDKHLPDGAGLGGGSADASFTLIGLREEAHRYAEAKGIDWESPSDEKLMEIALSLGADCPFFIYNRPAYAEGVGELIEPIALDLTGYWMLVVKPHVYVSTREAFSGISPTPSSFDLRRLPDIPISEWKYRVFNDFEKSIFPLFPEIGEIKEMLYASGAEYASLTGSGACVYGIYTGIDTAQRAGMDLRLSPTIKAVSLLQL